MNELYESLIKQLDDYSKELGLNRTISLSSLINSHRQLNKEFKKELQNKREEIAKGIEEGIKNRLTFNYVDLTTFLDLPLREIIDRYYEE